MRTATVRTGLDNNSANFLLNIAVPPFLTLTFKLFELWFSARELPLTPTPEFPLPLAWFDSEVEPDWDGIGVWIGGEGPLIHGGSQFVSGGQQAGAPPL